MNDQPEQSQQQEINIESASLEGQIGQAGRDVNQFRLIFGDEPLNNSQIGQSGRDLHQVQFIFGRQQKDMQQARLARKVLLEKIKNYWLDNVLYEIAHKKPLLDFKLEECLDVLQTSWGNVYETPEQLRRNLPLGTKVIDIFDQLGEGASLLILGDSGAGKTRILLELASMFITRAAYDDNFPLPVVLNISSLKSRRQKVADWLVFELEDKYQISRKVGKLWVEDQHLLLLLDGFHEVHRWSRKSCVIAINEFVQQYGKVEIVMCSRKQDYEKLSKKLLFQFAVQIKGYISSFPARDPY